MKFIAIAAAALAVAAPAAAQTNTAFTGVRAEATAGMNSITGSPDRNNVVYGAGAGIDLPVGDRATIGVEGTVDNVFERERTIGAAARVGYAFNPVFLGYVKGGYTNYQDAFSRKLDGAVAGAGVEYKVGYNSYLKGEYRYSDFARNAGSHAMLAGVGVRF